MINKKLFFPKGGSIIFWGDIFGGRYGENYHMVIGYNYAASENILRLNFNEGEVCTILNPVDISCHEKEFIIKDASLIIWEWFYYGRSENVKNLLRYEYQKIDNSMVVKIESTRQNKITIVNQPALHFC